MSKYIYSDNLIKYFNSTIDEEFASLSPKEMIDKLSNGILGVESNPADVRTVYTSRDAQEIRKYLISLINTLTDDWSDFNESDIGVALIELMAGVADMQGFYLDRQALECYISSVKQRKNGAGLLKLINYNLHMTRSSTTTGRFTLYQNYDQSIIIPRYTQVSATLSNKEKVYYATAEDAVVLPGYTEVDIPLIQGEVHRSSVKIRDLRVDQKIKISTQDIAEDSLILTIDGLEWTQVPDVLIDDEPGAKFSVYEDKDCQAYIYFHNSYRDYLPDDDELLADIKFLVSAGKSGQIREGLISKVESDIFYNGESISRFIEVTNIEPSSGGADRETLDEARVQAPKTLSMLGKAIVLQDFEDMATEMQGVLKCKALDWSVDGGYVTEPYLIQLYIVPTDGYDLSTTQIDRIKSYFDGKKVNYQKVEPMQAKYIDLDLELVVDAYVNEANKDYLKSKIISALQEALDPSKLDFGTNLYISDIKSIVRSASDSIVSVDIPNLDDNIYPRLNEFIRLNNIEVTVNSKKSTR